MGETSHSARTGAATETAAVERSNSASPHAATTAAAGAGHIDAQNPAGPARAARWASRAVRHSSKLRPVTSTREVVRTMASTLVNASYGSVARANASRYSWRANVC